MSGKASSSPGSSATLAAPLATLVAREPLWIEAGESVAEAARRMHAAGAGSILVAASPGDSDAGPGIVTDRDLRSRVLAADRAASTPVGEVASRPLHVVPADAPVFTAHLRMLEAGVHHLAVVRPGSVSGSGEGPDEIVGVVSSTDLLRHQSEGPFWILHRLERLFDSDGEAGPDPDLSAWAGWVERAIRSLAESGVEAARVARIVSNLNDHLTRRLLRRAVDDLGPAPTPWAWIVFGSEGRHEQTLLTDQDNALVFADPVFGDSDGDSTRAGSANEADEYFRALAERMTGDLLAAGFPPCPGGYMATHWCAPLSEWTRRFRGWIEEPEPEALLGASIFFDFRRVDGDLDLAPLHEILEGAGEQSLFLHHLYANSCGFRPPLGLFGRLKTDRSGTLDLKSGGLAPLVGLARVAGLAAGGRARRTVDRLRVAADEGILAREDADRLDEIFRFLLDLRLRRQLVDRAAGREPTSAIRPADLTTIERDHLQSAMRRLAKLQDAFTERW